MPGTKNYNQAQAYHLAGCALFVATYLRLMAFDAAGHLINRNVAERALENDLTALAVLAKGAAGRGNTDLLVEAAAIVTGTQPEAIYYQLLTTAVAVANKDKVTGGERRGRRAAWRFKTPGSTGVKIAS
jgi:hypothetical protein